MMLMMRFHTGGNSMGLKLRRNQNYLILIGMGVILFGIWSLIKTVLFLALGSDMLAEYYNLMEKIGLTAFQGTAVMLLLVVAELCVRLYVGLYACREGFGEKQGNLYVAMAVCLTVVHAVTIVGSILTGLRLYASPLEAATSLLMELISFITLLELINSVTKVRWFGKIMEQME
jgi:hypothetical protein